MASLPKLVLETVSDDGGGGNVTILQKYSRNGVIGFEVISGEDFFYSHVTVYISSSHTLYGEIVAQLYDFPLQVTVNLPRNQVKH